MRPWALSSSEGSVLRRPWAFLKHSVGYEGIVTQLRAENVNRNNLPKQILEKLNVTATVLLSMKGGLEAGSSKPFYNLEFSHFRGSAVA